MNKKIVKIEDKIFSWYSDKKIIISCSWWADSMMLLDLFYTKKIQCREFIVAHINHALRKSAKRDEKIILDYCKKREIICETFTIDVKNEAKKNKTSLEECGRNIRKKHLKSLINKYSYDMIATAHHADDQAETLLYHIIKWTSITWLVGIEKITKEYIRPLICITKKEILEYNNKNNIPFWTDETNFDTKITRNFLRIKVLPDLANINPRTPEALIRLWESATLLKSSFDEFFYKIHDDNWFTLQWYETLPLGFKKELIRYIYEWKNNSTHGLSTALIDEILRFFSTNIWGTKKVKKLWLTKKQSTVFIAEIE